MWAALIPLLGPVLERLSSLIPDPEARARAVVQAQAEIVGVLSSTDAAQSQTNTVQAQHPSFFVAGARPAFLWLCVVLVAYHMALRDIINALSTLTGHPLMLQSIDTGELWVLTFGLLGLSGIRSFDKVRGVDTKVVGGPAR